MTNPRITIIGLGLVGGSMGLALKNSGKPIEIIGHDRHPERNHQASKMGAVDKTSFNLPRACRDADMVILAIPLLEIRETLQVIGPDLKQGCVVTDTATLKQPALAWAAETLKQDIFFIGGAPILNLSAEEATAGLDGARADLFQDMLYPLCLSPKANPQAAKLVTGLVNLLQARPFYLDPVEHDGLRAAVETLPILISLALMQQAAGSPSWREARKLADHIFDATTAPLAGDAAAQRARIMLNSANLLPRIDALIDQLTQFREWIADDDADALQHVFDQTTFERDLWLDDRAKANWETRPGASEMQGRSGLLGNLFGLSQHKPKDK